MKTTTMQFRPVDQSQWTWISGWMDLTEEAVQQWGSVPSEVRIKPADPEPVKPIEFWCTVHDGPKIGHVSFDGPEKWMESHPDIRRIVHVREVLPGDDERDDLHDLVEELAERERKAYAQFDAKAEEARTLRAEVEKLRAERDRAWEQYNTFKRLCRERGEESDRLRETLNTIAKMAKDGAA